jgi:hypothetical protein
MEQFSSGTRPPIMVSTGNGQMSFRPEREITKAVYCTCWDGDIVIDAAMLKVSTSSEEEKITSKSMRARSHRSRRL